MRPVVLPGKPTGIDPREEGKVTSFSGIGRRGPLAKIELADAYMRVFKTGGASERDRAIVLTDLAEFSGFYSVSGDTDSGIGLARHEGGRSVFGRIFAHLNFTDFERAALERASREEALRNVYEGEI